MADTELQDLTAATSVISTDLLYTVVDPAGKKRTPLARALVQLDPGPPAERYRTARGAALGAARRGEAEEWIADLRQRVLEEGVS